MFSLLLNHWGLQLFVCFLFICFYLIKKSCSFLFMLLIVLWNCNFLLVKEIRIRDILPDWLLNSFWSCVVLLANLLVMLRDPVSVKLHIIGLMISHWLWKLWHTEFMVNSITARFPGPVGGKLITLPPPCLTVGMRRLCSYALFYGQTGQLGPKDMFQMSCGSLGNPSKQCITLYSFSICTFVSILSVSITSF